MLNALAKQKRVLYRKYRIDETHQRLFDLFGEIGLSKLLRRYVQLRNFYFLDKLIYQIALRTGYEEGLIRCLLPEEVENLMDRRLIIDSNIRNRQEFAAYVIHDKDERILSGHAHTWIKEKLDTKLEQPDCDRNKLHGTPVSLGYIEGICKIIIRPQDTILKDFRVGQILVSESTDPDLIDVMKKAGGRVTKQG